MIYSSGSIAAQKLLFGHTDSGDLNPLLSDYFDTTTAGPKTEAASYRTIAAKYPRWRIEEWLFLSDNVKEVRAALEASMRACVVRRPGNPPLAEMGDASELDVIDNLELVKVRPGVSAGEGEV
jgi:enolase-phosphatase E1